MIKSYPLPEEINNLSDVIEQLKRHRQSHQKWIDFLNENPYWDNMNGIGSIENQIHYVSIYNKILQILENMPR